MATPGEFDPTYPEGDRDGAGAEGGAMGGDSAGDSTLPPPLQSPEEIDRTNPFNPPGSSTPYPPPDDGGEAMEISQMNLNEWELDPNDIPRLEDFMNVDEKKTVLDKALRFIKDKFPKVDFKKLGPIGYSKILGNEDTIVRFGPKGGEESVFRKDGSDLENYEKEFAFAEKVQKQRTKERGKLQKDVDKLQATYSAKVKERNEMETGLNRTKSLDELEERYETLKRENEEDQRVVDDENATSSDKQAAAARMEERREELERLEPQIQQREEALPLRERVKNIFKKYGWTLQAVVLAVGLVLSALAPAGLKGLKAGTKAVGQGLKNIGQKLGSLLSGLIGSIVSYIFKAAGQVLSFLGEHAWLLILAVVAFFMERLPKKRRKQ